MDCHLCHGHSCSKNFLQNDEKTPWKSNQSNPVFTHGKSYILKYLHFSYSDVLSRFMSYPNIICYQNWYKIFYHYMDQALWCHSHTAKLDSIFIQIYMDGARGVKKTGRAQGSISWCVFALIFSPNWTNFEKPHKIKKIYQNWLFCDGFSKFVQFGLNISTKRPQVIDPWVLPFFLTPLAPLS